VKTHDGRAAAPEGSRPASRAPAARDGAPERFEAVVQSISDGVLTVDREWRITCFNRAAEAITGYRRADVLGRFCHEILRSDLCHEACPMRHTLETGTPVSGVVVYVTDAQGGKVPVSVSTALVPGSGGPSAWAGWRRSGTAGRSRPCGSRSRRRYTSRATSSPAVPRVRELLDSSLPVVAESDSIDPDPGGDGDGEGDCWPGRCTR
jgi:PAS domain S-box-containing protein